MPFPQDRSLPNNRSALYAGSTSTDAFTASYRTAVADYDPTTGHAITQDGQQFTIGATTGAEAALGQDAWKWVLLDPLHPW